MPLVGFEPTISTGERPYTYAVDRAATGTGFYVILIHVIFFLGAIAPPQWARASPFTRFVFLDHTQRHTTVGRTPLDE